MGLQDILCRAVLLLGLIVLVSVQKSFGAEWSVEPALSVKGDYNSNLLLTSLKHEAAYGHWVSPGAKFAGTTEHLEVSGRMAGDFVRYYGGQNLSFTNLYFPLTTRYNTERDTVTLDGGFTRDNTLMGELLQTGVVLRFTQRNLWSVNPSWTHALNETLSLQSTYQYLDASYQDGRQLGLVDYVQHIGTTGIVYKPTDRDQVQVAGIYINFHVPDVKLRSAIYGGIVSATHSFTESLTGTIAGGPRVIASTSHATGSTVSDNQVAWVFSGNLEKKYEDFSIRMEVGREINPSGFGLLLRTDRLGLVLSKQFSESVTITLSGQAYLAEGLTTNTTQTTFPQNRYINVSPRISWRLLDWWTLDVAYTYAQRDVESASQTANANSTYLMLTYYPVKMSLSR